MTCFHRLMTSWWRNMFDIFYILSIPEIFYYHVIILKSSLDTLVKWYNVPNFGVNNCGRTALFLPQAFTVISLNTKTELFYFDFLHFFPLNVSLQLDFISNCNLMLISSWISVGGKNTSFKFLDKFVSLYERIKVFCHIGVHAKKITDTF